MIRKRCIGVAIAAAATLWASAAYADHLQVSPHAPLWVFIATAALLAIHIGGGAIGIVSGAAALVFRKGSRLHRAAGKIFFVSMLVAYAVATCVAPFLYRGQRTNTVAGILALYLLLSGWRAATQRNLRAGAFEYVGLAVAVLITGAGLFFMQIGAKLPSRTVDGTPSQTFILFAAFGAIAAIGELNVIVRQTIAGVARIARHLWRMCVSLFIASGSFFLGQQRIMPEWIRGSPVLLVCALAPLAAMIFWLIWVRLPRRFKNAVGQERARG